MNTVFLIRDSYGKSVGKDPCAICTTKEKAMELMEELFIEESKNNSGTVTFNRELGYIFIDYKGEFKNRSYDIEEYYLNDWL